MCSSSSSSELSREEERVLIRDIALAAEANGKEGDTFYMITQRSSFSESYSLCFDFLGKIVICSFCDG